MIKPTLKHKFKHELKRQTRLAITAAIGFIIAFSWKDTILAFISKYVQYFTSMTSMLNVSIVSSIVATLLGVALILLSSRILE